MDCWWMRESRRLGGAGDGSIAVDNPDETMLRTAAVTISLHWTHHGAGIGRRICQRRLECSCGGIFQLILPRSLDDWEFGCACAAEHNIPCVLVEHGQRESDAIRRWLWRIRDRRDPLLLLLQQQMVREQAAGVTIRSKSQHRHVEHPARFGQHVPDDGFVPFCDECCGTRNIVWGATFLLVWTILLQQSLVDAVDLRCWDGYRGKQLRLQRAQIGIVVRGWHAALICEDDVPLVVAGFDVELLEGLVHGREEARQRSAA
mmetsp:Transcript_17139/g.47466  ORF Transcript_17139/g.47466 Transcript_17139/m.47466 type:complete len:260 (-) Transcript_17139:52-831(-)